MNKTLKQRDNMKDIKDLPYDERKILFYRSRFSDEPVSVNGTRSKYKDKEMYFFPTPYLDLIKEYEITQEDKPIGWTDLPVVPEEANEAV